MSTSLQSSEDVICLTQFQALSLSVGSPWQPQWNVSGPFLQASLHPPPLPSLSPRHRAL